MTVFIFYHYIYSLLTVCSVQFNLKRPLIIPYIFCRKKIFFQKETKNRALLKLSLIELILNFLRVSWVELFFEFFLYYRYLFLIDLHVPPTLMGYQKVVYHEDAYEKRILKYHPQANRSVFAQFLKIIINFLFIRDAELYRKVVGRS